MFCRLGPVWLSAVPRPAGPEFGTKGATLGQALQWRYPRVLYAAAPRPDARSARRPYTWRKYLAPMWQEETGAALWRPTRHGRVGIWDDPPACWHLRPLRRLTLFEGETAAGRPHTLGVDWWGRVWDNDPARHPPPPTLGPRRRGWTWPVTHFGYNLLETGPFPEATNPLPRHEQPRPLLFSSELQEWVWSHVKGAGHSFTDCFKGKRRFGGPTVGVGGVRVRQIFFRNIFEKNCATFLGGGGWIAQDSYGSVEGQLEVKIFFAPKTCATMNPK